MIWPLIWPVIYLVIWLVIWSLLIWLLVIWLRIWRLRWTLAPRWGVESLLDTSTGDVSEDPRVQPTNTHQCSRRPTEQRHRTHLQTILPRNHCRQ